MTWSRARCRAFVLATLIAAGCTPQASTPVRAAKEPPRAGADPQPAPEPALQPFAWERVLVVGWGTAGGPGIASVAEVGQRLSVMVDDGAPWTARVEDVVPCEDGEPSDTCPFVTLEYDRKGDDGDPPSLPPQWDRPGTTGEGVVDDVALLETRLAAPADTALPRWIPHTLEVRYANALCEDQADDESYVLLRTYSSTGDDPVKDVAALRDVLRFPRRVVTLRALDRTLHFVTVAKVERPKSGRMFDIRRKYETAFWILEDVGDETKVLHHEHHEGGRNINQDTSCQLPLRYPTPWGVVETNGVVQVLTRSRISTFERWSMGPDRLVREGGWTANVNPLH